MSVEHHRVVIVGSGAVGVTVAARLGRAELSDVALIEPSDRHCYQPLWTLVGGGVVPATASFRSEAQVIPRRTRWVQELPCIRTIGGHRRYRWSDVTAWLKRGDA